MSAAIARRGPARLLLCLAATACLLAATPASSEAAFGIKSFSVEALEADGSPDLRAGSHPYELKVRVAMNLAADLEESAEGSLRSLIVKLPAGMAGNPTAVPRCPRADFEGQIPLCPANTQVGLAHVRIRGNAVVEAPVFNLVPPLGSPFALGLSIDNINSFQEATLDPARNYAASVSDLAVPPTLTVKSITESIWGLPASEAHRPERFCPGQSFPEIGGPTCPAEAPLAPFLTLPTECRAPLVSSVEAESLEQPGVLATATYASEDEEGAPAALRDCEAEPFAPTLTARPDTAAAESPTGLEVDVHVPQSEGPQERAAAHLEDSTIVFPPGLVVDPSSADGLGACSEAEVGYEGMSAGLPVFSGDPARCPASSRLGSVEVDTPLVDHPLAGSIYLAAQGQNPFGSLIALYIVVEDPRTGVIAKLPGKAEPDPVSGRLTATFAESPQLPFEDLVVSMPGGPRAPLSTPALCGTYTTTSTLVPWSAPEGRSAHPADSFAVSEAPGGGPCAGSEAELPSSPAFQAGTLAPLAGAYSPFVVNLRREPGTQQLRALNVALPPGLTGRLAGIAECPEADIAAAAAKGNPGEGAAEAASPSCPASSLVGSVDVGAGSGAPLHVSGRAYLAGPYKGAPLSMAIVTPALAGPFDLGVVVVRVALYVNEETAQITAVSDPIPTILAGIPLQVRSVSVRLDREPFTLNPTSCDPKTISGQAVTPLLESPLAERFQVGGCRGLEFKPQLKLSLKGATKRAGHPALKAVLTYPKKGEYANIARAQVGLPHALFLDNENLDKVCKQADLHAGTCPKGSIYGHAKAWTPLLGKPLEGPVYLGVGYGHKLPDVVADLNGQIRILLHARVDTTRQDGIRNTFEVVPDAPVSRFVLQMKGGKHYSLIENHENLCRKAQKASARFVAQNGKVAHLQPKIATSCKKKKTKSHKRHRVK